MTSQVPINFEIKDGIHGLGVFTKADFKKGRVLFRLKGPIIETPTRTSIQIAVRRHIEDPLGAHINHSCIPSARFDRWMRAFICIQDLAEGEEITFDYTKNEDFLAAPFICECCQQQITGRKLMV